MVDRQVPDARKNTEVVVITLVHAGMTDEERVELEAMRAREAEWEAHLEAQEQRLREAQELQWAQVQAREAECNAMRAQWEEMKGQVQPCRPRAPAKLVVHCMPDMHVDVTLERLHNLEAD